LKDYKGSNDGTIGGATWEKEKTGQYSLDFDGSDDYVTISDIGIANKTFTLFAWLANTRTGTSTNSYYLGQGTSTVNQALHVGRRAASGKFTFAFYSNDLNSTTNMSTDGSWEFWVCTFNHSTKDRRIYRNGVLDANDTASANFQGTGNFFIGRGFGTSSYFLGKIGLNGIIHDRVLTANEIKALYEQTYIE
jgi:hypothetical protein